MCYQLLTDEDFTSMPWKNGKGETLELLRKEDERGVVLRVSRASVSQSGDFSDFSGLTRYLVVISGRGIRLKHSSDECVREHELVQLLDMAVFDGADRTSSELIDGPILDLNIMVRAADYSAQVTAIKEAGALNIASAQKSLGNKVYFYANEISELKSGATQALLPDQLTLTKGSLLCIDAQAKCQLVTGSGILFTVFQRR